MKIEPTYEELKQRVKELENDLIQWHQAEELLSESEDLYRHLIESARDVIYTVSPKAEVLSVNPAFEQNTGWSSDEIIGKQLTALVHPDDWALAMEMGLRTLNGEKTPIHEIRILTKSGEYAVCEFLIAPFIRRGKIIAILGIGRDITEKKRLEEALKESETRYRGIFNYTNNGVAVYRAINAGEDFVFTDFNQAAEKIDGIRRKKVVGNSVLKMFPGIKDFGLFDVFQRVWRTGRPERHPVAHYEDERNSGWRENYVYKLPSGEIVAVYSDETERMRAEDALKGAYKELEQKVKARTSELSKANLQLIQEINERKQAEIGLELSNMQWRSTFDAVSSAVCLLNLEGTILKCNTAMAKSLQEPFEKIIGATCWKLVHKKPTPIEGCPFVKMLETLKREVLLLPDGDKWLEITVDPVLDEAGMLKGAVHIVTDITERKRAEDAFRQSEERLSLAAETANLGMWGWRFDIDEILTNKKFLEMTGITVEETRGFSLDFWLSKIHPDDRERTRQKFSAHFKGETEGVENELRLLHPEKGWVWLYGVSRVVERDKEEKPVHMVGVHQDITARKHSEAERDNLIMKLQKAISEVKTLSGLLPICASCKKIRDDKGYWNQIEAYIREHSQAEFSHSICPECVEKLYPHLK